MACNQSIQSDPINRKLAIRYVLVLLIVAVAAVTVTLWGTLNIRSELVLSSEKFTSTSESKMKNSKRLVIMSDNRPISFPLQGYHSYAALINYMYCKRHGYDFLYYDWGAHSKPMGKNQPACGQRASPWCKVASLYDAMNNAMSRGHEPSDQILFLDSDAVFAVHSVSLDKFISNFSNFAVFQPQWHIATAHDWGFSGMTASCTGIVLLNVTHASKCILKQWWSSNSTICAERRLRHNFEQWCFEKTLRPIYASLISVFADYSFDASKHRFWRHVGSKERDIRMSTFDDILRTQSLVNVTNATIEAMVRAIQSKHTVYLNGNSSSFNDLLLQDPVADSNICLWGMAINHQK